MSVSRLRGFAGNVTLSLDNAPAGVTGTFAPNPVTADRSTLTVRADTSVTTGKRSLAVKGASPGLADHARTFVLDVLSAAVPGYTLTLSPTAVTAIPGGSGVSTTVTLHRTGGFTGAVSLGVSGHPTGVTWTSSPASVTDSLATLTLTAGFATQPGTYTLTVLGTAAGLPGRQATLQLTVQEALGFSVALSQTSISTAPGAAPQTVSVLITRTGGFADTVRLSMTGLPAGITATFNPAATTAGAQLTIGASTGAAAGTYVGTLHATATGMAERTAQLTVTILASSTDIVWRFCSPTPTPVFFAFQDGVSPYVVVPPAGDGSYLTGFAAGRGSVTVVVPGLPDTATSDAAGGRVGASRHDGRIVSMLTAGYTTYMYYGSTSDLQQLAQLQCPAFVPRKTVHGSVAGVPAADAWTVGLGGASAIGLPPGAASTFTLTDVLSGPRDLVAARAPFSGIQVLADALVMRRGVDAADGSTLPVVDFAGAEAFAPAAGTLVLGGVSAPGGAEVVLGFLTANGTNALLGQLDSVNNAMRPIAGVPTVRLRTGDLHTVTAAVETSNPQMELAATLFAAQVGAWTLSIPAPPPLPTVDVYATSPVIRLRARGVIGSPGAPYAGMVHVSFVQPAAQRATVVYQTRGFIGTTQNFEIRTAYNTLPGWSEAAYGFLPGVPTTWTVELLSAGYVFSPADGSIFRTMSVSGQVVP